jgi:hypothetical protein
MNWYKTAKLAETLEEGQQPIYYACAKCEKLKKDSGEYIAVEEMDVEERQQYENFKKTIDFSKVVDSLRNNPIMIEEKLKENPEYTETYQQILSGTAPRISHGYCPSCLQEEMAKYQKTAKIEKKPYKIFKKHKTWPESEKKYLAWGWAKDGIDAQKQFLGSNPSFSDELAVGYEILVELDRDRLKNIEEAENAKKVKEKRKEDSIQDMWWNK